MNKFIIPGIVTIMRHGNMNLIDAFNLALGKSIEDKFDTISLTCFLSVKSKLLEEGMIDLNLYLSEKCTSCKNKCYECESLK